MTQVALIALSLLTVAIGLWVFEGLFLAAMFTVAVIVGAIWRSRFKL